MLAETNVAAVQLYSVVMYTYRIATTLINQKFSVHVECRKSQLTHRAIWVGLVMSMFPRLLKKQLAINVASGGQQTQTHQCLVLIAMRNLLPDLLFFL
jgi:hypothetical protein